MLKESHQSITTINSEELTLLDELLKNIAYKKDYQCSLEEKVLLLKLRLAISAIEYWSFEYTEST